MPIRRLKSINNNKKKLLDYVGFGSIKEFRKDSTEFRTDASAYKYLLGEYNDLIDLLNDQEREEKRAKKEAERRRKAKKRAEEREKAKQKKKEEQKYIKQNVKVVKNSLTGLWRGIKQFAGKDIVVEYIYKGKVLRSRQYT